MLASGIEKAAVRFGEVGQDLLSLLDCSSVPSKDEVRAAQSEEPSGRGCVVLQKRTQTNCAFAPGAVEPAVPLQLFQQEGRLLLGSL